MEIHDLCRLGQLVMILLIGGSMVEASKPIAVNLRVEYLENPMGLDTPAPRFSWEFVQKGRGRQQGAYRIQVADSLDSLEAEKANVWDSGKAMSNRQLGVRFAGEQLQSGMCYYWRVKVWDSEGTEGEFSTPASFEMGLMEEHDWSGTWIAVPMTGNGYHSKFAQSPDDVKWVQVDLGAPEEFSAVEIVPARPYCWNTDIELEFGFPVRYKVEASDDVGFETSKVLVDRTKEDQVNPERKPVVLQFEPVKARYIRLTASKLGGQADGKKFLALAEFKVTGKGGENLACGKRIEASDSLEEAGWSKEYLTDESAKEIGPPGAAPLIRHEFRLEKPVKQARAYAAGLGWYHLRVNGAPIDDSVLEPAYTSYGKRVLYRTYDVTHLLKNGANAVGVCVGKGRYGGIPHFIMQMNVEFQDGSRTSVVTGPNWKWSWGPVIENSVFNGETYDARCEQPGWDSPNFDDTEWHPVKVVPSPTEKLTAEILHPIRVIETIEPKSITSPAPGVWVCDFGQNFSGWCRLQVSGPAGTEVVLKHAELINKDGTVNQANLRSARATDRYILKGEGTEVYEPRFTYHGFRYVQVEGFPGELKPDSLLGMVVHTDLRRVGSFECSNELVNKIYQNSMWGYCTNWHSLPTDCPQRDERQGWLGDAQVTADTGLYSFDVVQAYLKVLQDIQDVQGEDGRIPDTAPHAFGGSKGDPMWAGAYHFITWDLYRHTGDQHVIADHYEGLKRYADMLLAEAERYILRRNIYGDWIAVVPTPGDLISTAAFYRTVHLTGRMARVIGRHEDAAHYERLSTKIADAFNACFFNSLKNVYGNGSQCSNILPLYLGIVPEDRRAAVVENLVNDIMVTHKGHLSTGFVGTRYLLETLCDIGQADVAWKVVTRKNYPGWGYMIANGATTIWELWELKTGKGMNSHNHPALGAVSSWFYGYLAGIKPTEGFRVLEIKPYPVGDLNEVQARVNTVQGRVESHWKRGRGEFTLDVLIPGNCRAHVWVPKPKGKDLVVTESGLTVWNDGKFVEGVEGVKGAEDAGGWIKLEVGSGSYSFQAKTERGGTRK